MLRGFDEADLLALIEDELDPADAERVRRRLASDPHALQLIEQMREDRALLRATPEPRAPGGLLAELEPILARPMLMPQTAPRRRWRRPLVSAVAAAVALATLGGLWATLIAVLGPGSPRPAELVEADTAPPAAAPIGSSPDPALRPVPSAQETWPPPGTVIHHRGPLAAVSGRRVAPRETGAAAPAGASERVLVAADFMLVVRARDADRAEQMLRRGLSDLGGETALVRNFTYREADELGASLRLAEGRRAEAPAGAEGTVAEVLGPASARGREATALPSRPRPRPRPQDRPEARFARSGLLAGSEELAPPFERQLDFSERGAAYTLSVPAARLMQVLARLQLDEEHETALRVESEQALGAPTDEQRWLKDWPLARQAAEALDAHGRHAVILLPVVVEEGR